MARDQPPVAPTTARHRMPAGYVLHLCGQLEHWKVRPSLDQVASKLGCAGASTFARAFQKWTGTTAAAFKRAARSAGEKRT